ncbi:MAG: hypothetical protein JWN61_780 [Pseudonocardiales bacterium]|nr:hypothetical protein [Jatrophihabitantaceae bacterium]MCW2602645.1 hypothetical protein [Pseudonocardiales bacterium]
MRPDSRQITAHKAAVARVIRLEDALLDALADDMFAPAGSGAQIAKLREALNEAYAERARTQSSLFGLQGAGDPP